MTTTDQAAVQVLQQVVAAAVKGGIFGDTASVVAAHNALIQINQQLDRLEAGITYAAARGTVNEIDKAAIPGEGKAAETNKEFLNL